MSCEVAVNSVLTMRRAGANAYPKEWKERLLHDQSYSAGRVAKPHVKERFGLGCSPAAPGMVAKPPTHAACDNTVALIISSASSKAGSPAGAENISCEPKIASGPARSTLFFNACTTSR